MVTTPGGQLNRSVKQENCLPFFPTSTTRRFCKYVSYYTILHLCEQNAVPKQGREVDVRRAGADSFGSRRRRSVWGISLKLQE